MTPVVIVRTNRNDDEEKVEPMYVLFGVAFFFSILYVAIVLYRRYMCHMSWLDSLSVKPRNPRIEYANRAHRRDDVESAPKKPTIVRFKIDGKVLGVDD